MIRNILLFVITLCFICNNIFSQEKTWYDSIAISFLQGKEFGHKIGFKKDTINNKVTVGKNFYSYISFSLKIDDTTSIYVINFGAYDSDGEKYIGLIDKIKQECSIFFLGDNKFEDDLLWLGNYFKRKNNRLKNIYELEIADLFLRSKSGQIETPKYLH